VLFLREELQGGALMPREHFDIKEYEKNVDQFAYRQKIMPELRKVIKKSQKILDFGCGLGYIVYRLSKEYPSKDFYGIDLNRKAISGGKKRYLRKNLHLNCGKLNGKYDVIFTLHVLHEIKGTTISKQIKEFSKHLEDRGYIYIYDFRKNPKKIFRKYFIKEEWHGDFEEQYKEHNKMYKRDYEILFKKSGFKTICLKDATATQFYYIGQKVK
jgi:2-polyprenyl-3-methyl-5-hydroxy-6-metoxy-1,4-benzoquinol methylase